MAKTQRTGSRKSKAEKSTTKQMGIRLPVGLIDRIDVYAEKVRTEVVPGVQFTRTDAIRALLEKALRAEGIGPVKSRKK